MRARSDQSAGGTSRLRNQSWPPRLRLLARAGLCKADAARALGLSKPSLTRLAQAHGIQFPSGARWRKASRAARAERERRAAAIAADVLRRFGTDGDLALADALEDMAALDPADAMPAPLAPWPAHAVFGPARARLAPGGDRGGAAAPEAARHQVGPA